MCQPHWEACREAIRTRGLYDFVAADGKEALTRVIEEMEGEKQTQKNFDPLMSLNNAIWGRAIESFGLGIMVAKEDGSECCPLCEVKSVGVKYEKPDLDNVWIAGASDMIARTMKELPPE